MAERKRVRSSGSAAVGRRRSSIWRRPRSAPARSRPEPRVEAARTAGREPVRPSIAETRGRVHSAAAGATVSGGPGARPVGATAVRSATAALPPADRVAAGWLELGPGRRRDRRGRRRVAGVRADLVDGALSRPPRGRRSTSARGSPRSKSSCTSSRRARAARASIPRRSTTSRRGWPRLESAQAAPRAPVTDPVVLSRLQRRRERRQGVGRQCRRRWRAAATASKARCATANGRLEQACSAALTDVADRRALGGRRQRPRRAPGACGGRCASRSSAASRSPPSLPS